MTISSTQRGQREGLYLWMLTARSPAIPGSRFFPEAGTLLSSPCLTQLSPLGQVPPCLSPGSVFPLLSYQESDQMALGVGPPRSHIFQAEMEDLFFAGLACEGWGIPAFTDGTADPTCSRHDFLRRPDGCVLSHTHPQPESLVTKLCVFGDGWQGQWCSRWDSLNSTSSR